MGGLEELAKEYEKIKKEVGDSIDDDIIDTDDDVAGAEPAPHKEPAEPDTVSDAEDENEDEGDEDDGEPAVAAPEEEADDDKTDPLEAQENIKPDHPRFKQMTAAYHKEKEARQKIQSELQELRDRMDARDKEAAERESKARESALAVLENKRQEALVDNDLNGYHEYSTKIEELKEQERQQSSHNAPSEVEATKQDDPIPPELLSHVNSLRERRPDIVGDRAQDAYREWDYLSRHPDWAPLAVIDPGAFVAEVERRIYTPKNANTSKAPAVEMPNRKSGRNKDSISQKVASLSAEELQFCKSAGVDPADMIREAEKMGGYIDG